MLMLLPQNAITLRIYAVKSVFSARQRLFMAIKTTSSHFRLLVYRKKCPYIHGYFVASFHNFNGTGSLYVCVRKSTE